MVLIRTSTVSTAAFERTKEKFYGFRQTVQDSFTRCTFWSQLLLKLQEGNEANQHFYKLKQCQKNNWYVLLDTWSFYFSIYLTTVSFSPNRVDHVSEFLAI